MSSLFVDNEGEGTFVALNANGISKLGTGCVALLHKTTSSFALGSRRASVGEGCNSFKDDVNDEWLELDRKAEGGMV